MNGKILVYLKNRASEESKVVFLEIGLRCGCCSISDDLSCSHNHATSNTIRHFMKSTKWL